MARRPGRRRRHPHQRGDQRANRQRHRRRGAGSRAAAGDRAGAVRRGSGTAHAAPRVGARLHRLHRGPAAGSGRTAGRLRLPALPARLATPDWSSPAGWACRWCSSSTARRSGSTATGARGDCAWAASSSSSSGATCTTRRWSSSSRMRCGTTFASRAWRTSACWLTPTAWMWTRSPPTASTRRPSGVAFSG